MTGRTHIILVNWNGAKNTIECLESLLRLKGDFTVTVCDNGSIDGSPDRILEWALSAPPGAEWSVLADRMGKMRLRQPGCRVLDARNCQLQGDEVPFLTVLKNGRNLGFAGGNNAGIRLALADPECTLVWLLNNDTVVEPEALEELIARMEDTSVAVCGSTLLYYDEPDRVQALGASFSKLRALAKPLGFGRSAKELPDQETVEARLAYVIGASLLARRHVFQRTGGLYEDYFLYFEELELSRGLKPGERLGWAPRSIVYHKEGGSIGTSSRGRASPTSIYYLRVNLLRFYRRHHFALLPLAFLRVAGDALRDFLHGDNAALRATSIAVTDFLSRRGRTGPLPAGSAEKRPAA